MAGKSFLRQVAGVFTEILGIQSSAGAGNAGDIPALDSTGRLDVSMMPVGIAAETVTATASEALSAGDFVNLWNNAGTMNVRKADASTTGKEANGFVLSGFASSATATVFLPSQLNTQRSGLTAGATYWLSDTVPGGVVTASPTGVGKTSQVLGKAISATVIDFVPLNPIALAS